MLTAIDEFIERELAPLQEQHPQYFDHRREFARTDLERGGAPVREWDELLVEMMRRADAAGLYRFALPSELGGSDGTNLEMAMIREYLSNKPTRPALRPADRELVRGQLPDRPRPPRARLGRADES